MPRAIHIKTTAEPAELAAAPILCATRAFIERAQASGGLTLTLGGALSRADTKALFDITEWPDYDRASVLAVNKVLNEDDVLPIQFTRMVAQDARLLRAAKGRLLATRRATPLLEASGTSDLFRIMFETAFWRINLAYFDGLPIDHWPQTHIGVVLWSLSVAAHDWTKPDELLSTCTMPEPSPRGATSNVSVYAMITRVLRPATWFGLLECKQAAEAPRSAPGRHRLYRKTPLFDRLVSFDVELKPANNPLH